MSVNTSLVRMFDFSAALDFDFSLVLIQTGIYMVLNKRLILIVTGLLL